MISFFPFLSRIVANPSIAEAFSVCCSFSHRQALFFFSQSGLSSLSGQPPTTCSTVTFSANAKNVPFQDRPGSLKWLPVGRNSSRQLPAFLSHSISCLSILFFFYSYAPRLIFLRMSSSPPRPAFQRTTPSLTFSGEPLSFTIFEGAFFFLIERQTFLVRLTDLKSPLPSRKPMLIFDRPNVAS